MQYNKFNIEIFFIWTFKHLSYISRKEIPTGYYVQAYFNYIPYLRFMYNKII